MMLQTTIIHGLWFVRSMDMKPSIHKSFLALVIFSSRFHFFTESEQFESPSPFEKKAKKKYDLEHDMEFKIVGGKEASIKDFPFMISLQMRSHHLCGGSILTKLFILTAAHCVVSKITNTKWVINDPLELNIVAGQTVLDLGDCQYRDVKNIYVHSGYNATTLRNDIAVLEIFEPLEWTKYTKVAEIFSRNHPSFETHDFCVIIGWGSTEAFSLDWKDLKREEKKILQQVDLHPSSNSACERFFTSVPQYFDETKLCVILSEVKDACSGDSGGPIICNGIQYGIVSFGLGCAQPNMPAVFTNVTVFHGWIDGVLNKTEKSIVARTVVVVNLSRTLPHEFGRIGSINGQFNLKCCIYSRNFIVLYAVMFLLKYY